MKNQKITSNEVSNTTYFNEINQEYVSTINTIFSTQTLTDKEKLILCKDIIEDYKKFKSQNNVSATPSTNKTHAQTQTKKTPASFVFIVFLFIVFFVLLFAHTAKAQTTNDFNNFKIFVDSIKTGNNLPLEYDYTSNVITERKAFKTSHLTLWHYYNARLPKMNVTKKNKENQIIIKEVSKITIQKDTTNEIVNTPKIDTIKNEIVKNIEVPTNQNQTAPKYKKSFTKIFGTLKMNKRYKGGWVKYSDNTIEEISKEEFERLDKSGELQWVNERTFIMSKMKEAKTLITQK